MSTVDADAAWVRETLSSDEDWVRQVLAAPSRGLPSAGIAQPGDVIASLGPGGRRAPDQYAAGPLLMPPHVYASVPNDQGEFGGPEDPVTPRGAIGSEVPDLQPDATGSMAWSGQRLPASVGKNLYETIPADRVAQYIAAMQQAGRPITDQQARAELARAIADGPQMTAQPMEDMVATGAPDRPAASSMLEAGINAAGRMVPNVMAGVNTLANHTVGSVAEVMAALEQMGGLITAEERQAIIARMERQYAQNQAQLGDAAASLPTAPPADATGLRRMGYQAAEFAGGVAPYLATGGASSAAVALGTVAGTGSAATEYQRDLELRGMKPETAAQWAAYAAPLVGAVEGLVNAVKAEKIAARLGLPAEGAKRWLAHRAFDAAIGAGLSGGADAASQTGGMAVGAQQGFDLNRSLAAIQSGAVGQAVMGAVSDAIGRLAGRREMSPAATRDVAPESGVSQPLPEPTAESAASTPAGTRAGSPVPGSDTPAGVSDAMTQDGSVPASPAGTIEDVQAFARIKQLRDAIRQAAADLDARIASALGLQPGTDVGAVLDRATTKAEPSKGGAPAREPSPADVVLNEARIIRAREDQRAGRTSQAAPRTTDPTAQGEIPPVVDAAQTSQRAGESTTSRLADRTGPAEGNTTRGGVEPIAASTDVTSDPARTAPPESKPKTEVSNGQEEGRPQGLLNDKSAPPGTASAGVDYSKYGEVPLRRMAKARGLDTTGTREELIARLTQDTAKRQGNGSPARGPTTRTTDAATSPEAAMGKPAESAIDAQTSGRKSQTEPVEPRSTGGESASPKPTPATGSKEPSDGADLFERSHRLRTPIKGKNGAEIVGYRWMSQMEEGMFRDRRVSDWSKAQTSAPTGRQIVHLYLVKTADGTETLMGVGAAKKALGISEERLYAIAKREAEAQGVRKEQWDRLEKRYQSVAAASADEATRAYRAANDPNKMMWGTREQHVAKAEELVAKSTLLEKQGRFIRTGDSETIQELASRGWTGTDKPLEKAKSETGVSSPEVPNARNRSTQRRPVSALGEGQSETGGARPATARAGNAELEGSGPSAREGGSRASGETGPAKEGLSRASEPKTIEQRLLDFADRMKQERAQTPDPRRGGNKPGQRTGSAPIFKDTVTLAAELAARAAAKGIQAAKAVHAFVHEQMGSKEGDPEARRVTRIVRGILSDSVKDGKVDYDAFEYAANAAREAATRPAKVNTTTVREATGQAPESRSVTERAALKATMKAAAKGSREGFKAGKAEGIEQQAARTVREVERTRRTVARQDRETARRELRVLSEQLTDAAKRRESMQSIEQRGAVESARADEKGKAATAQGLRDEAIRMIEEYAPPNERGKYIRAANKATTFGRLGSLVERLRSDMETREIRRGLRAADRAIGSETDKLELDKELRDQLQTAIGTVERIRRRFQAKTGPARSARELLGTAGTEVPARLRGPTADEIAVLRDDLSNAINAILGVRHEQKTLDRVRVKGEEVEASVIRREVNDRLSTRKEIPAGDVPDARDRGWFRRSIARRTNMRAMMTALDGGKSGGPGRRIFGRMLDARSKSLALQHSFEDGLSEIVTRNGYANLGRWSAEWGGTLNKGAQKMVDVAFGPFKKLTMDQAAYLYASWGDEGFRSRIRAGQEIQFRAAPTEKPISVGPADFERLTKAIPEKVRKIIDESKALYDRTYFDRLSDVNKKMRGYHLDKTEGYWGIKLNRSFTEGRGTPQSWRRAFIRSLEESGFMQEREGPSEATILIGDFSHDIIGRSRAAATTIGKAETVKLLTRVFLHPETMPTMTEKFGKSFVERMERRISEWSGGETPRPKADAPWRMALGLWARGKTQLWVPTWARNVVGGAVRLMDILPASSVLKSVAGVTPERFKELRAYSPEMRERFDAGGLGAYMHGSASGSSGGLRPVAASHLKDGLRGTLAGLGETISAMSKMNPGEAREALRGVGRSWESFLDAMSIGNFFDGASAMMAYDHFLRAAPEKYVGERRKQWAATRAARAFERISNTATIEYANDVQLDARQSGLLAMLMPFTGDTAKAQSMIAESAMTGKLGRTAAVLGVGAIASGLVSSLWGSAKGEKTEDAAAAGATRVGQELVSLIPGVGNVMSNLIPAATGQAPRDSAALETPLASLATDAIQAIGNVLDGLKAMNERSATRREKYKALALRGFGGLADAAGSAAGLPTGYVPFTRKAFANWSGQNENNAAKLVSAFNRSSGRTGKVASQKRDARADLWLAIRQDNPEAAAAALEDLSHAGVRFTNQMLEDLQRDRHPLNDIPLRDRRKFLSSLSDEQRKAIDAAIAEHTAAVNRSSTVIRQARGKQTASK